MKENGIRYDEEISKLLHFGNIDLDNLGLIIDLALDKAIEEVKQISDEKYIRLTLQSKQTRVSFFIYLILLINNILVFMFTINLLIMI